MQVGQNQLEGWDLKLWMNVDWDASSVVAKGTRSIHVERDLDAGAMAGKVLID
jgi:hypothetical protein